MPTSKRLNVAVVGATGMAGQATLSILAERRFPAASVRALASERSKGRSVPYNGSSITLEAIDEKAFKGVVKANPAREDLTMPIQEQLIVELYSK